MQQFTGKKGTQDDKTGLSDEITALGHSVCVSGGSNRSLRTTPDNDPAAASCEQRAETLKYQKPNPIEAPFQIAEVRRGDKRIVVSACGRKA
jgi:hypothetical protein